MLEHASPSGVQLSLPLTSFLFLVLSWALWTHFSKSEFTSHQAPCQFHSSYRLNNDLLLLIFFTVLLQTMRTILQSHKPPAKGLPWRLSGKEPTCQCRRRGFDPWVRKIPLKKEMATHSSILAWRIPWTEKPGGLQSMGLQRARHNLATKQQGAPGLQSPWRLWWPWSCGHQRTLRTFLGPRCHIHCFCGKCSPSSQGMTYHLSEKDPFINYYFYLRGKYTLEKLHEV